MRNDTIRVATFAGPGEAPVIRAVPWPEIPDNAALIKIGACGVCGCSLVASVHIPLEAFPVEPRYEYPAWCWKAKN